MIIKAVCFILTRLVLQTMQPLHRHVLTCLICMIRKRFLPANNTTNNFTPLVFNCISFRSTISCHHFPLSEQSTRVTPRVQGYQGYSWKCLTRKFPNNFHHELFFQMLLFAKKVKYHDDNELLQVDA